MQVSIHDTSNAIHGLVPFDEAGEAITRVQEFDTETFLCKLPQGKRTVAAGFVISCSGNSNVRRYLDTLPDILQQFICYHEDPNDTITLKEFVQAQLEQRKQLRGVLEE